MDTVDILCAVYNGGRFLPEFLASLDVQTHANWRLWICDDGSTDDSLELVRSRAQVDRRVVVLRAGTAPRGATRAFAWLLEHVPSDATHIMCADQDDVWLPNKIEHTLRAMREAEAQHPGLPILVHTDLAVVDAELRVVHPSFWEYARILPEAPSLRRLVVRNPVTGAAMMVNRSLLDLAVPVPSRAVFHDWWLALVAAAFGRVVTLHEATILYRQHGNNVVGASDLRVTVPTLVCSLARYSDRKRIFRENLALTARQAAAFVERYGNQLDETDRRFVREYAALPHQPLLRRKHDLLRLRTYSEQGLLRNAAVLLLG